MFWFIIWLYVTGFVGLFGRLFVPHFRIIKFYGGYQTGYTPYRDIVFNIAMRRVYLVGVGID